MLIKEKKQSDRNKILSCFENCPSPEKLMSNFSELATIDSYNILRLKELSCIKSDSPDLVKSFEELVARDLTNIKIGRVQIFNGYINVFLLHMAKITLILNTDENMEGDMFQ